MNLSPSSDCSTALFDGVCPRATEARKTVGSINRVTWHGELSCGSATIGYSYGGGVEDDVADGGGQAWVGDGERVVLRKATKLSRGALALTAANRDRVGDGQSKSTRDRRIRGVNVE